MSMTREEAARTLEMMAIDIREELAALNIEIPMAGLLRKRLEVVNIAQEALRPVSREQVENVWRGEWIAKHYVDGILEGVNFDECSKCGYQRVFERQKLKTKFLFCPACGAPMTDKAVQVVMERLEALHEIPPST